MTTEKQSYCSVAASGRRRAGNLHSSTFPFSGYLSHLSGAMSSPAPLLRPPIPGGRSNSGSRTPRLGLAIPASPSQRPVTNGAADAPSLQRPSLPQLRLATPSGSNTTPDEKSQSRPNLLLQTGSVVPGSSDGSSRSGSLPDNTTSATSQYSTTFTNMLNRVGDPLSAVGSMHSAGANSNDGSTNNDNSVNEILPDLEALSLEKGRPLDVEDLDDAGWKAACKEGKIQELGTLGEGAGGAVTRCVLKGGKTVFALKVSQDPCCFHSCESCCVLT